jgi:hypothetical protein
MAPQEARDENYPLGQNMTSRNANFVLTGYSEMPLGSSWFETTALRAGGEL